MQIPLSIYLLYGFYFLQQLFALHTQYISLLSDSEILPALLQLLFPGFFHTEDFPQIWISAAELTC